MRTSLFSELVTIGYEIVLEGETIRLQYQKSGEPPESARQLIDELRECKAEAIKILKTGNTITQPASVEPGAKKKAIWVNPYPQGTPEARQESLLQCMGAMCLKTRKAIEEAYRGEHRQYKATPDILAAEHGLEVLQRAVLKGEAKLKDFNLVAYGWQRAALVELN